MDSRRDRFPPRPTPVRRDGFTAIELVIVVVMIGALAAFGFPRVAREIRRSRANQASSVVAADIEVAFTAAVANAAARFGGLVPYRNTQVDNWATY